MHKFLFLNWIENFSLRQLLLDEGKLELIPFPRMLQLGPMSGD